MGIVIGIDVGGSTTKIVGLNKGKIQSPDVHNGSRSGNFPVRSGSASISMITESICPMWSR